jgi:hypothetical protein
MVAVRSGGSDVTCEVMLMNLEGIALAADSAVTVVNARGGGNFSQNGVEKIFILDETAPIGAMIFGLATFGDYPWKTVLSAFLAQSQGAQAQSRPFQGVQDASDRLVAFLAALDSGGAAGLSLTPAAEVNSFRDYVDGFVDRYYVLAIQRADNEKGPFPAEVMDLAFNQLDDEILQDAAYVGGQIVKPQAARVARASIGKATERLAKFLAQHMDAALDRALKRYFANTPVGPELRASLGKLLTQSILVDWLPPAAWYTGLVVAGFGRKDFTPFFVNLRIQGAFGGVVQHRFDSAGAPIAGRSPVVFQSYAQDELIMAFRMGAQRRFIDVAYYASVAGLAQTFNELVGMAAKKDKGLAQEMAAVADRALFQVPAVAFDHAIADRQRLVARTFGPLLDSASLDTLGRHAAKLVQLSILEHELTGSGAVGRPISVLKMEKGKCRLEKDASV